MGHVGAIFSNVLHFAVYIHYQHGSCMPSHHLRRLNTALFIHNTLASKELTRLGTRYRKYTFIIQTFIIQLPAVSLAVSFVEEKKHLLASSFHWLCREVVLPL